MDKLQRLGTRLDKLGIKIQLAGNYPWVYLKSINNVRVPEKLLSAHGYTIYLQSTDKFVDLRSTFKLIREKLND